MKKYKNKYYNDINHKQYSDLKLITIRIASNKVISTYYNKLIETINAIPLGGKVVDIGTAQGVTLNFIHNIRPDLDLYGIDMSDVKDMLPDYVKFIQADIISDKIDEKDFDLIISRHLIEHLNISDLPIFFDKCYSMLNKNGKCFILAPALSNRFYDDPTHIRPFNKKSLKRLFTISNFNNIESFNCYAFNIPKGMKFAFAIGVK